MQSEEGKGRVNSALPFLFISSVIVTTKINLPLQVNFATSFFVDSFLFEFSKSDHQMEEFNPKSMKSTEIVGKIYNL